MTPTLSKVLLGVWNRDTGQSLTHSIAKEYKFFLWEQHRKHAPFGERELVSVLKYLNAAISKGARKKTCLNFDYIVGDPENFEQILQFSNEQASRPKPPTERQKVIAMTTLSDNKPKHDPAQSCAAALERTKLAAQLREWRENNL